jgi:uncharacterized protein
MRTFRLLFGMILGFVIAGTTSVSAQGGDQILDGIGETGLNARYIFNGDFNDWSRNNLHARIQGSGFRFTEDEQFRNVLSLPGDREAYVSIPGESLTGLESLSITGWVFLRSANNGQILFDFGKNNQSHFLAAPRGTKDGEGYQVQILSGSDKYSASSPAIEVNRWNHLAIVINVSSKTLSSYVNGRLVSEVRNVDIRLEDLFDLSSGNNMLYVGKSRTAGDTHLNARLHDFRIYRIALSAAQVAGIHANALNLDQPVVRTRSEQDRSLPRFPETTPQLYTAYLASVPDIQVETALGHMPRLPRFVPGVYNGNIEGPAVRVIWPSPTDNSQVLSPGTYTVTGRVAGTDIRPIAVVTVKAEKALAHRIAYWRIFISARWC